MTQLQLVTASKTDWNRIAEETVSQLRTRFSNGLTRPRKWRVAQLVALQHFLVEREQDLIDALAADLRKPTLESTLAEIGPVMSEAKLAVRRLRAWMKPRRVRTAPLVMPGRSQVQAEPLGVVLIISPWNYPVQTTLLPLVSAIAAGNCVVLKPSEVSSHTSALLARWLPKYLDTRTIKVFEGGVVETTALLAQRWDHIFYTGNGKVGRIVMGAAAKQLSPVTLELGGKSPCIVSHDADLDVAAQRIVFGKFFNAGQTCVAPDYVLVEESVHDALVTRLSSTVRAFYGDDPQQSPDYGRIINGQHHERLARLLSGAQLVCGGQMDRDDRYIAPTIVRDVKAEDPVMQEEIFGPILPVISVPDLDAAMAFINERPLPLAIYGFTRSRRAQQRILDRTQSGAVTFNHVWLHLGVHELPFGGIGESGMGAYHGRTGFETFSHRKAVLTKPFRPDPSLLYPPYSDWKRRAIEWLSRRLS